MRSHKHGIQLQQGHLLNMGTVIKGSDWYSDLSWFQKQDLTTSLITTPNGELYPEQRDAFVRILELGAVLLQMVTIDTIAAKKSDINKIRQADRVLRPGQELVALSDADRTSPTHENVEFDTVLLKGEVRWSREFIEDNIEGDQYISTLMEVLGAAVARDLDELFVNADVTSADTYLALLDGLIAQVTSNVFNAGGGTLDVADLSGLLRTLPKQFRAKDQLRWWASPDSEENFRDFLGERIGGLGDQNVTGSPPVDARGIRMVPVPVWPDDLGGGNQTAVVLTAPDNIGVAVWRQVTMETVQDVRAGAADLVISLRTDMKIIHEPAASKAINIDAS